MISRALSRLGIAVFVISIMFAVWMVWADRAFAQEATPEASPPTQIVVSDGANVTVNEEPPDELAPLFAILSGVAGIMTMISPLLVDPLANVLERRFPKYFGDNAEVALGVLVASIVSYLLLSMATTQLDIFTLAGIPLRVGATFPLIFTAILMGFGGKALSVFFLALNAVRVSSSQRRQ